MNFCIYLQEFARSANMSYCEAVMKDNDLEIEKAIVVLLREKVLLSATEVCFQLIYNVSLIGTSYIIIIVILIIIIINNNQFRSLDIAPHQKLLKFVSEMHFQSESLLLYL